MFLSCALLAAVLAPWTPVQGEGTKVGVWGRSYDFVSNALPVSATSQGREFLTGPMRPSNCSPTEKVAAEVQLLDGSRRLVELPPYSYLFVK